MEIKKTLGVKNPYFNPNPSNNNCVTLTFFHFSLLICELNSNFLSKSPSRLLNRRWSDLSHFQFSKYKLIFFRVKFNK